MEMDAGRMSSRSMPSVNLRGVCSCTKLRHQLRLGKLQLLGSFLPLKNDKGRLRAPFTVANSLSSPLVWLPLRTVLQAPCGNIYIMRQI